MHQQHVHNYEWLCDALPKLGDTGLVCADSPHPRERPARRIIVVDGARLMGPFWAQAGARVGIKRPECVPWDTPCLASVLLAKGAPAVACLLLGNLLLFRPPPGPGRSASDLRHQSAHYRVNVSLVAAGGAAESLKGWDGLLPSRPAGQVGQTGGMRLSTGAMVANLDARGLLCPLPVLKARKRLAALGAGDRLVMLSDDPAAVIDVPHFCSEAGHRLVESAGHGDGHRFVIEKGGDTPV